MKTDFHNKDFALSLALKWRLRWTRKWPITVLCAQNSIGSFLSDSWVRGTELAAIILEVLCLVIESFNFSERKWVGLWLQFSFSVNDNLPAFMSSATRILQRIKVMKLPSAVRLLSGVSPFWSSFVAVWLDESFSPDFLSYIHSCWVSCELRATELTGYCYPYYAWFCFCCCCFFFTFHFPKVFYAKKTKTRKAIQGYLASNTDRHVLFPKGRVHIGFISRHWMC